MPKATTKSKYKHPNKLNSSFDITLNTFLESGYFTLTKEILTTELLIYFNEYLKKQAKPSSKLNYKFYLENVTFNVGVPTLSSQEDMREATLEVFLNQVFSFSPKWSVIAFDNVTILQGENHYPLSSHFILLFLARFKVNEDASTGLHITNALIVTNAEFHSWAWMKFLTLPPRLDSLTLELLSNEDQEDNFLLLCDALHYAKIKILHLGTTKISVEGYHALNELLGKNCWIEKVLLKEPTDPASHAICKKNNNRLLYLEHEKYLGERWPLAKFDVNQLMDNETRTIGHWLLENALESNNAFVVNCLIKAGANLLEQRGDEKPFLIQIFDKDGDFKLHILNHIFYDKTLVHSAERVFQPYSNSKEVILRIGYSLISYAETLRKRACPYLLNDSERLVNLLKNIIRLSRPSKQRDKEFIEIYYRLFKCLALFHDTEGRVTVESISNVQSTLDEIEVISKNAEWGWRRGSKLHQDLPDRLDLLKKNMKETKQLIEKDGVIIEKGVAEQQAAEASTSNEPGPSTGFFPKR